MITVICNDSGGAIIIKSWLKFNKSNLRIFAKGAAIKIFKDSKYKIENKINLIKFNMDKSIQVKKREVDQGIIVDDKEGFIARNGAFVEFLPDKIFGFLKSTKEKTQAAYIVRENAPDPLEFNKESLYWIII